MYGGEYHLPMFLTTLNLDRRMYNKRSGSSIDVDVDPQYKSVKVSLESTAFTEALPNAIVRAV